jgi:hypothetical protein
MRFIAWTMLVAFALAGVFLVWQGIRALVISVCRRPHLKRVKGTVMTVERTRETRASAGRHGRMRTYVKFHPVIQFTTELGESVRFRSEMGESYPVVRQWDGTHEEPVSRYSAGQIHEVLYDPEGKLPPCLATWVGLFGPAAAMSVAGIVFMGGAALIWFAFREKLLGH